ncbi:MAG: hypothetical protein KF781_02190 [Chitinophagaceae bacterium]|nr:hypothetical protein [Chitinophagaceae bacterium]
MISCKKNSNQKVTLIRDCTGTYLRCNGKDYKVCNPEKVASFSSNATIPVTFRKISECKGSGNYPIVCYMYHEYDSWVEIEGIR